MSVMKSTTGLFNTKVRQASNSGDAAIPEELGVSYCVRQADQLPIDSAGRERSSMVRERWPKNWIDPLILLAILLAINLILFRDFVFGDRLLIFMDIGSDTYASYYPIYYYFIEIFRSWDLSPYSFQLSLGNDILTIAYFLDLFFLPYLVVGSKNLADALVYVAILKILVAGLSMYAYLAYVGIPRFAAILCAIVFAFNGHMMLWGQHYFFASFVALLPLLFLAFERLYLESKGLLFSVIVAVLFPNLYLFLPLAFLFLFYFLSRVLLDREVYRAHAVSAISKKAVPVFGYGSLGVTLGAALWLPYLFVLTESPRISLSFTDRLNYLAVNFFKPNNLDYYTSLLLRFFSNNAVGTGDGFFGYLNYYESPLFFSGSLICVLLLPQIFRKAGRRTRILTGLIVAALIFSISFPSIAAMMNGLQNASFRWGYTVIFAQILLLALALRTIACDGIHGGLLRATALGILLVLIFASGSGVAIYGLEHARAIVGVVAMTLVFLAIYCLLFLNLPTDSRLLRFLLIGVLSVEVIVQNYPTLNNRITIDAGAEGWLQQDYFDDTALAARHLASIDPGFYRVDKGYNQRLSAPLIQGYRGLTGYNSLDAAMPFTDHLKAALVHTTQLYVLGNQRPDLSRLLSTKYLLTKQPREVSAFHSFVAQVGDIHIFEDELFLPLGLMYRRYMTLEDFTELPLNARDQALLQAVVVEAPEATRGLEHFDAASIGDLGGADEPAYRELLGRLRSSALNLTEFDDTHLKGTISVAESGLLFLSIPYSKGWRLEVNGETADLIRVQMAFLGILLEQGDHSIELRYRNPYAAPGVLISAISLVMMIVLARRRRHRAVGDARRLFPGSG
jgi:uncharacterized membrane protein YfhO